MTNEEAIENEREFMEEDDEMKQISPMYKGTPALLSSLEKIQAKNIKTS